MCYYGSDLQFFEVLTTRTLKLILSVIELYFNLRGRCILSVVKLHTNKTCSER